MFKIIISWLASNMTEEKNDEKKMEKVRKMLDNTSIDLSSNADNEYLASLHKRLTHDPSYQSQQIQETSDSQNLKPNVVIHHKKQSTTQILKSDELHFVVKKKSIEEQSLFDNEELFEIEKITDTSLPEFVEVTPPKDKNKPVSEKTTDSNILHLDETLEELPQWQLIYEEETSLRKREEQEPEKKTDSETLLLDKAPDELPQWQPIDEEATHTYITPTVTQEKKKKLKFSKAFKGSTVRQRDKEPQIWEEVDTTEPSPQKIDFSPVVMEDINVKKKEKQIKIKTPDLQKSHPNSYSYGEYSLYKKRIRIGDKDMRTVHFFSKDVPEESEPATLPNGYSVQVNEKTGVPYIKKNR